MKIIKSVEDFEAWFYIAEIKEVACYGIGNEVQFPPDTMLKKARKYFDEKKAIIFQKRQKDGSMHYLIKKVTHEIDERTRHY